MIHCKGFYTPLISRSSLNLTCNHLVIYQAIIFQLIILYQQNMGCVSTRQQVYQIKSIEISDRDIELSHRQLPSIRQNRSPIACGYEFSTKIQSSNNLPAKNSLQQTTNNLRSQLKDFFLISEEMKKHYEQGKIDQCYQKQLLLRKTYNEIDQQASRSIDNKQKQSIFALASKISDEYNQIRQIQNLFQNDSWEQNYQENAFTIKLHKRQNDRIIVVESESNISLDLLLGTFTSLSNINLFINFNQESKQIKKISLFNKVAALSFDLPFCEKAKLFFELITYNRLSHTNSVLSYYQSLYRNPRACEIVQYFPVYPSEVKFDLKYVICKLEPIDLERTKVSLLFRLAPEIEDIAEWIVSKMCTNIGVESMKQLISKANASGQETTSQYFQNNEEIYRYFNKIMKEWNNKKNP